jgi:putative tricarboxylic transport membrane protein
VSGGRERVAAAVLLLVGLAGAFEARRLSIGEVARPGPGFFPFYLGLALAVVALALLARSLARRARAAPPPGGERLRRGKAAGTLLAGVAYAFLLEPLGFLATTFLLLLFLFTVIEPKRWTTALALSALPALAMWIVFKLWLGVQLPGGAWSL